MMRFLLLFILTFSCLPTNNDSFLYTQNPTDFNQTICLEEYKKCQVTRSFFEAVCVAVSEFTFNAACFAMSLANPIICGIAEGLVRVIQKPCSDYNLRCDYDCYELKKTPSIDEDDEKIARMVCLISDHVCNLRSKVTSAIDELNANLKFRTTHNSLMMEIDYRASLFQRYTNSLGSSSGPDANIFDLFLDVALDFDSVRGDIFSLSQLFHEEIVGIGPPYVDLTQPPPFYDVHPDPCSSKVMASVDGTMLTLYEMAEVAVNRSPLSEEAPEFREWFREMRGEQIAANERRCAEGLGNPREGPETVSKRT